MKGLCYTPCPANGLRPQAANGIMSLQQPGVTLLATGAGKALNRGNTCTHIKHNDDVSIVPIFLTVSWLPSDVCELSVSSLLTPLPSIKLCPVFLYYTLVWAMMYTYGVIQAIPTLSKHV